jgi:epoxyqueuosine reductase QueG
MMEHPVLNAVRNESFTPLGWFSPRPEDGVPALATGAPTRFVILVGNAGPRMFARFDREASAADGTLDAWCRAVLTELAGRLDADVVFPFDRPALPFLTWARRGGAGHVSPLGLNIHPDYGLWHAYRGAFLFPVAFDIPTPNSASPCDTCLGKPCLSACPVTAFSAGRYDTEVCASYLDTPAGIDCMSGGCLARRACPVAPHFVYPPAQAAFHMRAFLRSRLAEAAGTS